MPHLVASYGFSTNLVGDFFEIDVVVPNEGFTLPAVIAPDCDKSYLGVDAAKLLGVDLSRQASSKVNVTLRCVSFKTFRVHEFGPILCGFHAAHPRLGPNHLRLGLNDLIKFLDIDRYDPLPEEESPPFLFMKPFPPHEGLCHELEL